NAHRARLARRVKRRFGKLLSRALRNKVADSHHLSMRRRIIVGLAEVAALRQHLALAHDNGAKRKIPFCRLRQSHAHKSFVLWKRRHLPCLGKSLARQASKKSCSA